MQLRTPVRRVPTRLGRQSAATASPGFVDVVVPGSSGSAVSSLTDLSQVEAWRPWIHSSPSELRERYSPNKRTYTRTPSHGSHSLLAAPETSRSAPPKVLDPESKLDYPEPSGPVLKLSGQAPQDDSIATRTRKRSTLPRSTGTDLAENAFRTKRPRPSQPASDSLSPAPTTESTVPSSPLPDTSTSVVSSAGKAVVSATKPAEASVGDATNPVKSNTDNLGSTKAQHQEEKPQGRVSNSHSPPVSSRTRHQKRGPPTDDSGALSTEVPALPQRATEVTALSRAPTRSLASPDEITSREQRSMLRVPKRSASMGKKQEDGQGTKRVLRSRHSHGAQSHMYRPIPLTERPVAPTGPSTQPPVQPIEVSAPLPEFHPAAYVAPPETASSTETRSVLRSGRVRETPPTQPRKRKSNTIISPTDASTSSVAPSESIAPTEERTLLRFGHEQGIPCTVPRKSKSQKPAKKTYVQRILQDDEDLFSCGLAEDEEDVYFARKVMDFLRQDMREHMCGDQPWFPNTATHMQATEDEQEEQEEDVHDNGSSRAQGIMRITPRAKVFHVPARQEEEQTHNQPTSTQSLFPGMGALARQAREARRAQEEQRSHTDSMGGSSGVVDQMRTRKKALRFAKSHIHDWGLYALEPIPPHQMVIEYIGEVVRQQVANERETRYELSGQFSTYLFRVDDDLVVDATRKGNTARLMNHSCKPNCTANIVTVGGHKRIAIYAKEWVLPGNELTYDYKLAHSNDEEPIPCLCGAEGCRKFL